MITSSEFFKKTFFELELDTGNLGSSKQNQNFKQINKTVLHRYSQLSNFENKNAQKFSNTKRMPKDMANFSTTKNRFNDNYNQIQQYNTQRKNHHQRQLDQFTIDVTPWNQNSNLTSRDVYESKQNLNKQRQKIKSTISKYKFTRTIQQNEKEHANFIKSPKRNKKVNYILYEYGNRKSKSGVRKKINLIKNIDLNKSYEDYLNHEIEFDKDFLFKSHAKVKTHNKHQLSSSHKGISREGKNHSLLEKMSEKQFMDDVIKKDLVCGRYVDEMNKLKLDTSASNQSHKDDQPIGNNGKLSERTKLLDKGKILKFEMNRRIFKGTKISLNGIVPIINSNNSMTQRQKINFQVSGNKTRKLQYSIPTD